MMHRRCPAFAFSILLALGLNVDRPSAAPLPLEAQKVLDGIPGRELTVDFVLQKAMASSESFRELMSRQILVEVPRLQFAGLTDTQLVFGFNRVDDRRQPNNPFGLLRTQQWGYTAQATRNWLSGTQLSVELFHGETQSLLPSQFVSPGGSSSFQAFETRATLTIAQSLWKDFLGEGLRAQGTAAQAESEAVALGVLRAAEDWSLGIVKLYYDAWLFQTQLKQSDLALQRRIRLERIVKLRAARGTSEPPDVLQVQTSRANTELQVRAISQQLHDIWRNLAISLKFPTSLVNIDARLVPLRIEDFDERFLNSCPPTGPVPEVGTPESNTNVLAAEARHKSSKSRLEAARAQARPDLRFLGQVGQNGVDFSDRNRSWDRFSSGSNNLWSAGLQLNLPIEMSAEKARVAEAYAEFLRSEAELRRAQDDTKIDSLNLCEDIKRQVEARSTLQLVVEQQKNRVNLEENRFSLGRIGAFQVIQAEDDAMNSVLALSGAEVEVRLTSWRLRKQRGLLKRHLEGLGKNSL